MLADCERLRTLQRLTLSQLVQAAFAGLLVLLSIHTEVVLRFAASRVGVEESAVATVEDIDLRVVKCWIAMRVFLAILRAHELSPECVSVEDMEMSRQCAYISGARCAEYSQWRMSRVLLLVGAEKRRSANCSLSQKFKAPSMCPPLYSYSKRQSMMAFSSYK